MDDIASLRLRVESLEVSKAEKRLQKLERQGRKTERASAGLTRSFAAAGVVLAGVAVAAAGLKKAVSVQREFDILNAGLVTATGSAEKAKIAFDAIQQFAQETPYDLQQVTDSFTKLVNYGLTPSERALTSYGNTSSALGKDLNQMVEAVADAVTGEFERLKEFGIKANKEGDKVKFTFRGVTTEVKNNAAEIERYLMELGENNFAGAMSERMKTLDGAISNLGDEWDKLWLQVSEQGVGDFMADGVRAATSMLSELNAMLASGELEGYVKAVAGQFDGIGKDARDSFDIITTLAGPAINVLDAEFGGFFESVGKNFQTLPGHVQKLIRDIANQEIGMLHRVIATWRLKRRVMAAAFTDETIQGALDKYKKELADINDLIESGSKTNEEERDAHVLKWEKRIEAAKKAREAYEKLRLEKEKANEGKDTLSQFGITPPGKSDTETETDTASKDLERVVNDLRSQEEAVYESYQRRKAIILANTEEGSEKQIELLAKAKQRFEDEIMGSFYKPMNAEEEIAQLEAIAQRKLEQIRKEYGERSELELELTENLAKQKQQIEDKYRSKQLQAASSMFGSMADLAKEFGGEQSKTYKALFAASKAFAIADATIKMGTSIMDVFDTGVTLPDKMAQAAIAAGHAGTILSSIKDVSYSGAYDKGGTIPAGSFGIVGEIGPEIVHGPAKVIGREDTAKMMGGSGGGTNVKIVNVVDPSVVGDYLATEEGEELIQNVVQRMPR